MSSGHLNDVTALAWMVQPLELPLTRCWHDCWLAGWPQVNYAPPPPPLDFAKAFHLLFPLSF